MLYLFSRDSPLVDERNTVGARWFKFSSLCRGLFGRTQVPPRRLVAARGALQRHPSPLEVQKRIVSVKTTQELPNLIGNHCPETPFRKYLPTRYDAC